MAADNVSPSGRFASFSKLLQSSNARAAAGDGDETGDPWDDSPLLTRRAGDHVCRPVIIGSDGRVTPVIALDALTPPPHRPHREAAPLPHYLHLDVYDEGGRGSHWVDGRGGGRAEEPAAVVGHGGWDRPGRAPEGLGKMGRAANSFEAMAEFLWGSGMPAAAVAGSSPSPCAPQQREGSSAVTVIESGDAAEKYGGKFVW